MSKWPETYEEVKSLFLRMGCVLLSTNYQGLHSKLEYIASCGHRCTVIAYNFFRGAGTLCRRCNPSWKRRHKHIPIEKLQEEYELAGCKLLSSSYCGSLGYLVYIAQCGHQHKMPYYCFHRGQGRKCPRCAGGVRKSLDEVRELFQREGCQLLSTEYKWNRQKVDYIAQCGHRHTIKASAFFEGEGRLCPKCQKKKDSDKRIKYTEKEQQDLLNSFGCKLILPARTTNDKMLYVAKCGHQVSMRIEFFKQGYGHVCKKCYQKCISLGERAVKIVLDKLNIDYAPQYVIHTAPGKRQRLDFYIPSERIAIEFNGRQHYEEVHFFHRHRNGKNTYDFEYSKKQDERKREWCINNAVHLIEIDGRIWTHDKTNKDEFENYLKKEICNGRFKNLHSLRSCPHSVQGMRC